jgi:hypothetical protein
MPEGELVTVPVPLPDLVTDSVNRFNVNVAVTDFAALMVTVQFPVPEQAPPQPIKDVPVAGDAVKVTSVL